MSRTVSLDLVNSIRIASPCSADWERMTGDERSRFCGECKLNVYNISSMTADEAAALIHEKEGRLCVRIYQRADGTVLTQDCPVGLRLIRKRAMWALSRAAAALTLLISGGMSVANGYRDRHVPRLGEMKPFSTIRGWMSPGGAARYQGGQFLAGSMCAPLPPPSTQGVKR